MYIIEAHYRDINTRLITDEVNRTYNGERFGIPFNKGVGRTTSRAKAQRLSEEYEYVVLLHKDIEPWNEEGIEDTPTSEDYYDEAATIDEDD